MHIPSLPTDNLYKFCAIAGIVLFLFGATYSLNKSMKLELRTAADNVNANIETQKIKYLKADVEQQTRDVQRLGSELKKLKRKKHISKQDIDDMRHKSKLLEQKQEQQVATLRKIQTHNIQIRGEVKKLHILFIHFIFISIICISSLFVGGVLMLFGFRRWYTLLQIPQDRIIADKLKDTNG